MDCTRNNQFLGSEFFESSVVPWEDESIEELEGKIDGHIFGLYGGRGGVLCLGSEVTMVFVGKVRRVLSLFLYIFSWKGVRQFFGTFYFIVCGFV